MKVVTPLFVKGHSEQWIYFSLFAFSMKDNLDVIRNTTMQTLKAKTFLTLAINSLGLLNLKYQVLKTHKTVMIDADMKLTSDVLSLACCKSK